MLIDPSHPRSNSLRIRERLVRGVKKGLTSSSGLLAHGRGEAFDYLLAEKTHDFAHTAIETACALLLTAKNPVLSINGNTAALVVDEYTRLAHLLNCKIEVNLFHYTKLRESKIIRLLTKIDPEVVLNPKLYPKTAIPGIASPRKHMISEGIAASDVVFIPLEDGDRCKALLHLGKKVITVDVNPLSRTSRCAMITIINNIVRTMPLMISTVQKLKVNNPVELSKIISRYNNQLVLAQAAKLLRKTLSQLEKNKRNVMINKIWENGSRKFF